MAFSLWEQQFHLSHCSVQRLGIILDDSFSWPHIQSPEEFQAQPESVPLLTSPRYRPSLSHCSLFWRYCGGLHRSLLGSTLLSAQPLFNTTARVILPELRSVPCLELSSGFPAHSEQKPVHTMGPDSSGWSGPCYPDRLSSCSLSYTVSQPRWPLLNPRHVLCLGICTGCSLCQEHPSLVSMQPTAPFI